jgi:hypothetical protein
MTDAIVGFPGKLQGVKDAANGGWSARCPAHDDQRASLSVAHRDGKWLLCCHAGCTQDAVIRALGVDASALFDEPKTRANGGNSHGSPTSPRVVATYIYRQGDGTPYLRVQRTADKAFWQSHWDGKQWAAKKPTGAKIPYRLPELLAAPLTSTVFVAEGEKDADNLAKLGFVATCNSEGADNGTGGKWTKDLNSYFKDRHVVVLPDNDAPGRKHAQHVASNLDGLAASVKVVELPGLDAGGDVSDWLVTDPSGARLVQACRGAPAWEPGADGGDQEAIAALARLSKLRYSKARKEAAKKIGITAGALDEIVAEARDEARDEEAREGKARWKVDPWDEAVNTAQLLADLLDTYLRHVVLPEHGDVAMALWTLHAWAVDAAYVSPFLMFSSPEMRCGKSTALALLNWTAPRTAMASNISPAATFRYIEAACPTLLIDEADTFVHDNEELRGILNSGHTRDTAHVIRLVGDAHEPKEFSTWAPKAVAAIGKLAATLRDRAVVIPMRRKKPTERVAKLRGREGESFMTLRRKAARWAADNIEALKAARPLVPEGLNDRAADNWEPLLAIADLAGGDWPSQARAAALKLSGDAEGDTRSTREQLLADVRTVFVERSADRLPSAALVDALIRIEGHPWAEYGKAGKPLTQNQLARLLKPFAIVPEVIRVGTETPRGYRLDQFTEAFERYLSSEGGPHPQQCNKCDEIRTSGTFQTATADPDVAVGKSKKPNNDGLCCGVAVVDSPLEGKCDHCGESATTARSLLDCAYVGNSLRLHQDCVDAFLASPGRRPSA